MGIGAIFEIIWDVETAGFAGKSSNGNLVTLYKPLSGEVIGTIHENPELLEAKNEQIS